jgi:UDP-N-acetyl-D-glucosamine dehydrogenase
VLILGLAYKPNIADCRESPSFEIARRLRELGSKVDFCDPLLPSCTSQQIPHTNEWLLAAPCLPSAFAEKDVLVVATAHDAFKDPALYENVKLVVDTRNFMARVFPRGDGPRVVKA